MNCQQARKWISPYLDSELDPTKTFEVSQHLEVCRSCHERFEREARADRLIAESLRRRERVVNWRALAEQVRAPAARVLPLRPRWLLAAAACVAFVIIGLGEWSTPTIANPARWAVEELHRLSPNCQPFAVAETCTQGDVCTIARRVLGSDAELRLPQSRPGGHAIQLAEAVERTCRAGKGRLQVRLNCCDKPVLLTIGHCRDLDALGGMVDALGTRTDSLSLHCDAYDTKFHVSARRTGDYVIVAVSPHRVEHLVAAVHVD